MNLAEKALSMFMPNKKNTEEDLVEFEQPKLNMQDNFMELIDRDSLHSLFPFSWEQYPTYVQSG